MLLRSITHAWDTIYSNTFTHAATSYDGSWRKNDDRLCAGFEAIRESERRGGGGWAEGETRFQVFHRLNEEQTRTIQDSEGEKIIIVRWKAQRERGREIHSLPHSCLICKVLRNLFFSLYKRMKRFFWSQKGLLSFLGSLSGRDVISINYLPHQRDTNMLAPFCFSHLIALFTEQLPMDNKCTHAPRFIQDNSQTQAK